MMRLSDFNNSLFEVIRDGAFETIGNFSSNPPCDYLSYAENEAYLRRACSNSYISCVICPRELSKDPILWESNKGIAISEKPRTSFNQLNNYLIEKKNGYTNSYEKTTIGSDCHIRKTAVIAEKGVKIGNNCIIEDFAVINEGVTIGNNVTIRTGAVIGTSSNIVARDFYGNQFVVKQVGKVVIENNVLVGAHTHIARGSFPYEYTQIGEYTTIDNNSEIAHNVKVGKNCIITAQCQICGNSSVGNNSRLNPMAVISNRIRVGDNCTIEIGSVVVNNLKSNTKVAGNFAIDHQKFLLWHRLKLRNKL